MTSEKVTFSCGWSELTQGRVKWLFLWWPWETVHILQQHRTSCTNYLLILTMTTASKMRMMMMMMMMMIMIRACRTSVRITLQRRQLRKRAGDWENDIKFYLQGKKYKDAKWIQLLHTGTPTTGFSFIRDVMYFFLFSFFLCSVSVKYYQYKIWLFYVINTAVIFDSEGTETAQCVRNNRFKMSVFLNEIWLNLYTFNIWYIKNHSNNVHYRDDLMTCHKVLLDGCKLIPTSVLLFYPQSLRHTSKSTEAWNMVFHKWEIIISMKTRLFVQFIRKERTLLPSFLPSTYLLTPCSRVLLEKLAGSQLVKKFPAFYGTPGSLPHLQVTATCSYPEPDQSSPCQPTPLP